jgi:biopolymer transport protein ExbB/TolQ
MFPIPINKTTIAATMLVVIVGALGVQTWRLGNAKERIELLSAKLLNQTNETLEAVDASNSKDAQLKDLRGRLATLTASRAADREERDRLLTARDNELAQARRSAEEARRERSEIWLSTAACSELASLRISTYCPDMANRLRLRSRSQSSDEDGTGGGTR